jgi:SAM-dependent methyltransferase
MKKLDLYLQQVRFAKARKFIRKGDRVLDIGAHEGLMFDRFAGFIGESTGIEPKLREPVVRAHYRLLPGYFPAACPPGERYDVITMLAVLEHIPPDGQQRLGQDCLDHLNPGGRIVITVPSPRVDKILHVLFRLRLIDADEMHLEEHYGFDTRQTFTIFGVPGLRLLHHSTFQFGLNNLFVFEKA